jgi:hypothetical protein
VLLDRIGWGKQNIRAPKQGYANQAYFVQSVDDESGDAT